MKHALLMLALLLAFTVVTADAQPCPAGTYPLSNMANSSEAWIELIDWDEDGIADTWKTYDSSLNVIRAGQIDLVGGDYFLSGSGNHMWISEEGDEAELEEEANGVWEHRCSWTV